MPNSNSAAGQQDSITSIATNWLVDEWARIDQTDGLDPGQLAQTAVTFVINALRRNPQWHSIRRDELDLFLATARQQIEEHFREELDGYLPADQMLNCAKNIISEVLVEIQKRKKQ